MTSPPGSGLTCEICATSEFDEVWLPDPQGLPLTRSGLYACRHCRLVFAPRPQAPQVNMKKPRPPDWQRYGPDGKH